MSWLLLIAVVGCSGDTSDATPPETTAPAETSSTAETATTTTTWSLPDTEGVAPFARFYYLEKSNTSGQRRFVSHVDVFPDISGDGLPDLVAHRVGEDSFRSGMPAAGEQPLADFDDRSTWPSNAPGQLSYAGDVNGDGVGDLWVVDCLHLGPVDTIAAEPAFCIGSQLNSAVRPHGNIDADGDGALDVAFTDNVGTMRLVYGPLDGPRDEQDPRNADDTTFGPRGNCAVNTSSYVGAGNRAGEMLLSVAGAPPCNPALIDLAGPRGRTIGLQDVIYNLGTDMQPPVYNLRDDGLADLAILGTLIDLPAEPKVAADLTYIFNDGSLLGGIRDLTGDGRDEFIAGEHFWVPPDGTEDVYWHVVPGQPDLVEADPRALGVHLGSFYEHRCDEFTSFDLDGDGLGEIIGWGPESVAIWLGSDIRDALLELGRLPDELARRP